jgi:hypothetical protein
MPSTITHSAIVPQKQSPLLRLPGELRNKIYEYALTDYNESEPVMLPGDVNEPTSAFHLHRRETEGDWHEVNQLKHVCRQLYLETRSFGLEQYTKLTFSTFTSRYWEPCHHNPGRAFLRFLESCNAEYIKKRLDRVVIFFNPMIQGFLRPISDSEATTDQVEMENQATRVQIVERMEALCQLYPEIQVEFNPMREWLSLNLIWDHDEDILIIKMRR